MAIELRRLLELGNALPPEDHVAMATVVRVAGSSYRKPGARMMIGRSGQRAGTVSGGCLEAEVGRKIWWLTEQGSVARDYSTSYDDDSHASYGLGCDGVVTLLLERMTPVHPLFEAMRIAVEKRIPSAIVTVIGTNTSEVPLGSRIIVSGGMPIAQADLGPRYIYREMTSLAIGVLDTRQSTSITLTVDGFEVELFAEYLPPPAALFIFGAGDDAQPVVHLAHTMGWEVTVADGRSNLATPVRFPVADKVSVLDLADPLRNLNLHPGDAAVVLTHSHIQDVAILRALLPLELGYLGVLGPRRRTERILGEVVPSLNMDLETAIRRLRSPVGLDLGSGFPEVIALSIVSEIQAVLTQRSAAPLHTTVSPEATSARG